MINVSQMLKEQVSAGAFNALLGIHAYIGNEQFLTKGGEIFTILRLEGVDFEGRDPAELDAVARQFQAALRPFDGGDYRFYQYALKNDGASIPFLVYPEKPVLNQAIQSRIGFLKGKTGSLYSTDTYLVVVQEGVLGKASGKGWLQDMVANPIQWAQRLFSVKARVSVQSEDLKKAQERLAHVVSAFTIQLADSVRPRLLDKQEAFGFLRRLVNFAPHKVAGKLKYDQFVDFQMCGTGIECYRDHLRFDDHFVKVLTLKEPPTQSFANMLKELSSIPSCYVISTEWKPRSNGFLRRLIQSKRRHHHNGKTSPLAYAFNSASGAQDTLIDDSAQALVNDLGHCLEEIEVKGNSFGEFSMTIILYDTDLARLNRSVAEFSKVFANFDAQLIEERYNILNAYLAILPGNSRFNLRRLWLSAMNHADLSFLFKIDCGEKINTHLSAEYLGVVETNQGAPYYLNLHLQDVGHAFIVGATGSGKSFLMSFLLTCVQKYSPRIIVFDLCANYENLARMFGGSYLPVASSKWAFSINPFVLTPTEDNLRFLQSLILVLVTSNGYKPTADDEKSLYGQIKNLYQIEPAHRRLSTLASVLSRNLRQELQKWVHPGPFASLFDNVEDTLTFSRFQVFDFQGFKDSPMLEPLLFYILHRANEVVLDPAESTVFKLLAMDEVWRFLKHPTIREYVLGALKTFRSKNGAVIMATQSVDDLIQTKMLDVVIECCPTKIFLANPNMNRETYRSIYNLTETEVDLIAGLTAKRQFMLKRPELAKVLNLDVDPKEYWLYTNDPYDNEKKREAFTRYGFEEGLEILARSQK